MKSLHWPTPVRFAQRLLPRAWLAPSLAQGQGSASPDVAAPACPSTSIGAETVRGITLLLVAACLATVVLLTQRVLQWWVGDDLFLAWTVTWCVLLASMQWLLRSASGWAQAGLCALDTWSQRVARQRALRRTGVSAR